VQKKTGINPGKEKRKAGKKEQSGVPGERKKIRRHKGGGDDPEGSLVSIRPVTEGDIEEDAFLPTAARGGGT